MKKWGIVITLLYAVIVLALLAPAVLILAMPDMPSMGDIKEMYQQWVFWVFAGIFIAGQFVLLSLSVDTTPQKLRPRTPIVVSAITTGVLLSIVTVVIVLACLLVVLGESKTPDFSGALRLSLLFGIPWIVWGVLFYRFYRNASDPITHAVAWLFRGSVLELLVAVPAHVIVRRRHDCCAPAVTGFGITSGIAIMLISFGPSVLLLFKKRMEGYSAKNAAAN